LSKQDARKACSLGVDGIWVSNHGGRALETDITSIEVLEGIKSVIPKKIIIIADGGVRTGTDVLKMLSLGADFVGIGRPVAYGIIAGGEMGVNTILSNLIDEFKVTMKLAGISNLDRIKSIEKIKGF
jgi:lactate 2-monooxygenase